MCDPLIRLWGELVIGAPIRTTVLMADRLKNRCTVPVEEGHILHGLQAVDKIVDIGVEDVLLLNDALLFENHGVDHCDRKCFRNRDRIFGFLLYDELPPFQQQHRGNEQHQQHNNGADEQEYPCF